MAHVHDPRRPRCPEHHGPPSDPTGRTPIVLFGDGELSPFLSLLDHDYLVCATAAAEEVVPAVLSTRADLCVLAASATETASVLAAVHAARPSTRFIVAVDADTGVAPHLWPAAELDPSWVRLLPRPVDWPDLQVAVSALSPRSLLTPVSVLYVSSRAHQDEGVLRAVSALGLSLEHLADPHEVAQRCEASRSPLLVLLDLADCEQDWCKAALQVAAGSCGESVALVPAHALGTMLPRLRHLVRDFITCPASAYEVRLRLERVLEALQWRWRPPVGELPFWLGTRSSRMRSVYDALRRIAVTEATVLLRGETGTGKEVLARALHRWSGRSSGPLFCVSCSSIADSLLESELFGHERGAFTGAVRRKRGLVELAAGGTLFLDEVGEFSPSIQVKLLRLLQEHEFMRVGGEEVLHCDARIVAATHRDLETMVERGQFRADLYYRIQVVPFFVPPLRERAEDLPELAAAILGRLAARHSRPVPRLSHEGMATLLRHRWPGNVRELENVLERSLLLAVGDEIAELSLFSGLSGPAGSGVGAVDTDLGAGARRDEVLRLLAELHGNVRAVAAQAAIPRRTLYRQLSAWRIDPRPFRRQQQPPP